jgi:tetratricopeptide (TPR) repeat protein
LRSLNPAVSPDVARAIESCLACKPEERPADAAQLVKLLHRHFAPAARLRRWARRRPRALAGLACVVLLTASAAAWSAASGPPAWVRDYNRGKIAYEAGDFRRAERFFDRAVSAKTDDFASVFGRGRAKLALGDVDGAWLCFTAADHIKKDGPTLALLAYCRSYLQDHKNAIPLDQEAIQAEYAPASVYNNRAYSLMERGKFDEAEADLRKALALDPELGAAHYNRARLHLSRWLAKGGGAPLGQEAIDDLVFVLERSDKQDEGLCRDAALLFAAAAPEPRSAYGEEAIAYLQRLVRQGVDADSLKNDPILRQRLLGHPRFPAVFETRPEPQAGPASKRNARLADPFVGLAE